MDKNNKIQLLQASTDAEDISEYRIKVDDHYIKHVTIDPGIYDEMDLIFEPVLIENLGRILCKGDWTCAHVMHDVSHTATEKDRMPTTVNYSTPTLPGIGGIWHPVSIDYLDLQIGTRLRFNVYEATHPSFARPVVIKFARFAWEIPQLEAETAAYNWIDGHGIGPDFLGHLTEHGRVIGFIMSRIENARYAAAQDVDICRAALQSLHALKIKHGDINKHNFLVRDDMVALIDFDVAVKDASTDQLRAELEDLERQLDDMSGRGKGMVDISAG